MAMHTSVSRRAALLGGAALAISACGAEAQPSAANDRYASAPARALNDAQWQARLQPAAYSVLRHAATERPFTSPLNDEHRRGVFSCAGCSLPLFQSQWKFDSGTGWPSFYRAINENLITSRDESAGMVRTEYKCARCLGHQGHLFTDGPLPTGLRYCNNGVALTFTPA